MSDIVTPGTAASIRIFLFNGVEALAGREVNLSIERLSDGTFWNGGGFEPGTYATVAMTELNGQAHYEGVYEYMFPVPAGSGVAVYDWSVKFAEGGWLTYFKGRMQALPSVWDEPAAAHPAPGTLGYELHLAKAALVNKRLHTIATGLDLILDDDDKTVLRTLTPSEAGGVITVAPS